MSVQVWFRHGARAPYYRPSPAVDWNPGVSQAYWWGAVAYNACVPLYPGLATVVPVDVATGADVADVPAFFGFNSYPPAVGDGTCRLAWLVPAGAAEAVALGRALRARYVTGPERARVAAPTWAAAAPSIFAATTNTHRTLNTLRGVLAGLYPDAAEAGAPIKVATGAYPSFFATFVGGNDTACPAIASPALAQARAYAGAHWGSAANQRAVAAFEKRLSINLTACVDPSIPRASPDYDWAATRCWQMAYESLAGAAGAGVPLPGGATDEDLATASDANIEFWQAALKPLDSPAQCTLAPNRTECASIVKGLGGWMPALVTCAARRALANDSSCDTSCPLTAAGGGTALGCGAATLHLAAVHDTHVNLWASMLGQKPRYWPWTTANLAFETWAAPGERGGERKAWVRVLFDGAPIRVSAGNPPAAKEFVPLSEWAALLADYDLTPAARAAFCGAGREGAAA